MAAAGVVCLQEFAQYDDWRIEKNMQVIEKAIRDIGDPKAKRRPARRGRLHACTTSAKPCTRWAASAWKQCYPLLRDAWSQPGPRSRTPETATACGRATGGVAGKPGQLYMTSVACFILAMPNRYLPILQEGKIDSLRQQFRK